MHKKLIPICTMLALALCAAPTFAADVVFTIKNEQSAGAFFLTPFWVGFHNGQFDAYNNGLLAPAGSGITEIAEMGDTSVTSGAFMNSLAGQAGGVDATITSVTGMGDAPVFSPGESKTTMMNVGDSTVNRYFSFASMVVPSNDLFVGNDNPMGYELFDAAGDFNGPVTIQLFGSDVHDNGSEVNNALGGAAFSTNGGMSADESLPIRGFFSNAGDNGYLSSFLNSTTASGDTITATFGGGTLIATITIVPEPATLSLLALAGTALIRRRRAR